MIIETLSTFPDMYASVMGSSMMRIAQEKGILEFKAHDLRDWTHDRHRTTDDDPYGGGDHLRGLRRHRGRGPAPDHRVPVAVR